MESFSWSEDEVLPEANVFENRADDILKSKFEVLEDLPYSANEDNSRLKDKVESDCSEIDEEKAKSDSSLEEPSTSEEDDQPLEISPVKQAAKNSRKRATSVDDVLKSKSVKRLPVESKRKIQELQLNSSRMRRRIACENARVITACDSVSTNKAVEDKVSSGKIILKFRYFGIISKQTVEMNEKISTLFAKVAEIFCLKPCKVLFCVNDQTIKEEDTPLDLNLKYFDIVDCIPCELSNESTVDKFLIKVQSSYSKKKVVVYGSKTNKLEDFMKKYSEMQDIPLSKLKFEFDGEVIEGSETPDDLEMENGSCIDVKILKENVSSVSCENDEKDCEIVADVISKSNQLQVCVLE